MIKINSCLLKGPLHTHTEKQNSVVNIQDRLSKDQNGPLTRYVKLRVALAPRWPVTFSPLRVSDPDMHHGTFPLKSVAGGGGGGGRSRYSRACATYNFTYMVRGPWFSSFIVTMSPQGVQFRTSCRTLFADKFHKFHTLQTSK